MMLIRIIISLALHVTYLKIIFIFKLSKIAWLFFVTGLETLQILKVQIHDEIFSCNFGLMIQKFHEQLAGDNILCYMFQCFMSLTSDNEI
jgi:hypothetical protein